MRKTGRAAIGEGGELTFHRQVRIDLGNLAGRHERFILAQFMNARGYAIEVRQFQAIEVGQLHVPAQSLLGDGHGARVAHTQADDPHAFPLQVVRFLLRHLPPVPVGAQQVVSPGAQHLNYRISPGEVNPLGRLAQQRLVRHSRQSIAGQFSVLRW